MLAARAGCAAVFVMSPKTMFNCAHMGNVRVSLARAARGAAPREVHACTALHARA